MKIVLKGWINGNIVKRSGLSSVAHPSGCLVTGLRIYSNRGEKSGWKGGAWPPRKVTVTIDDGEEP